MPDTMIERVARAICLARSPLEKPCEDVCDRAGACQAPRDVLMHATTPQIHYARAAIRALMEPTDGMWDAGRAQLSAGEGVMDIYTAMLTAALEETPDADE
jgi:hypothetical protein